MMNNSLHFSEDDYIDLHNKGSLSVPRVFTRGKLDPGNMYNLRIFGASCQGTDELQKALESLRKRVGESRYDTIRMCLDPTIEWAYLAFPAYRTVLPEMIASDWLACVDWRKFQRDHISHQRYTGYQVLKLLHPTKGLRVPARNPDGSTNWPFLLDVCVDATIEQVNDGFLGEFLKDNNLNMDSPWLKHSKSRWLRPLWKQFFIEAAYTAAQFHDCGYPWQYLVRLSGVKRSGDKRPESKPFDRLTPGSLSPEIDPAIIHSRLLWAALCEYKPRTAAVPHWDSCSAARLFNHALNNGHGLAGALNFLFSSDSTLGKRFKQNHPIHHLLREWVAVSIMMHDMQESFEKEYRDRTIINAGTDPLSALIALCDSLQDYARPHASFTSGKSLVKVRYPKACTKTILSVNGSTATITYVMKQNEIANKRKYLLNENDYGPFAVRHPYVDLSAWGISEVNLIATLAR